MERYNKYYNYLSKTFSKRMVKLPLDAGFSCPNIDGSRGFGGCTFCNNHAFSPALSFQKEKVIDQINFAIASHEQRKKFKDMPCGFIAFFQAYSNTYAPVPKLKELYEKALSHPQVEAISIATRADCLSDEILELIAEISQKTHLSLEIGVESIHNQTLIEINRGHLIEEFLEVFLKVKKIPNLYTCLHLIFGLPGETPEMMLEGVALLSSLKPSGIKFHQLEIVKDTSLERDYQLGKVTLLSPQEYIELIGEALKILDPEIYVERLFGYSHPDYLVAPVFDKPYPYLARIEKYLKDHHITQGCNL